MNALVLANFPVAAVVFLAMVGIPLWMTFKYRESAPDYAEARAHFRAKAGLQVHGNVNATPAAGLSTARQHAAARTTVPGRRHADPQYRNAPQPGTRVHAPAEQRTDTPAAQ